MSIITNVVALFVLVVGFAMVLGYDIGSRIAGKVDELLQAELDAAKQALSSATELITTQATDLAHTEEVALMLTTLGDDYVSSMTL